MALKDTITTMKKELAEVQHNLLKAEKGNKAAAQRVRTGTLSLAKRAKIFRKESIAAEKKGNGKLTKKTKKVKPKSGQKRA